MQFLIITLGIVLVVAGLVFAVGKIGGDKSGGGFRDIRLDAPAWMFLVFIGVGVVVFGAVHKWNGDTPTQSTAAIPPNSEIADQEAPAIADTPTQSTTGIPPSSEGVDQVASPTKVSTLTPAQSARFSRSLDEVRKPQAALYRIDGLTWTTNPSIPGIVKYPEAQAYCSALKINGLSFALPTIEQLGNGNLGAKMRKEFNEMPIESTKPMLVWSNKLSRRRLGYASAFNFTTLERTELNSSSGAYTLCVASNE